MPYGQGCAKLLRTVPQSRPCRPIYPLTKIKKPSGWHLPISEKCQPSVLPSQCPLRGLRRGLFYCLFKNCLFRSVANALVFRAFGDSAGLLLFACTAAFKTVCAIVVFSTAFTSRAGGVVINSRFLGHVTSPLLELCYKLSLAPHQPGHKSVHCPIS